MKFEAKKLATAILNRVPSDSGDQDLVSVQRRYQAAKIPGGTKMRRDEKAGVGSGIERRCKV